MEERSPHPASIARPFVVLTALLASCAGAGGGAPGTDSAPELRIRLAHGSEAERATADALRRVVSQHDVARWIFTDSVLIDETAIPHSHPVLTIHTRHLGEDERLLSTFLHEQFHWPLSERDGVREATMDDHRARWPDVPAGSPDGARDERSTYLHLIVCDLELGAMADLIGRDAAEELMRGWTHYRWIYRTVVDDPAVRRINARHGLVATDLVVGSGRR